MAVSDDWRTLVLGLEKILSLRDAAWIADLCFAGGYTYNDRMLAHLPSKCIFVFKSKFTAVYFKSSLKQDDKNSEMKE